MKLVKCRKCGATVMTTDTLLSEMQAEFNSLSNKAKRAKGGDKQIIVQQLSQLKKIMTQVCHSSTEAEIRKNNAYNELILLKKYLIDNNILSYEILDKIQKEAREQTKIKVEQDDKRISDIYGDFRNMFYNDTKRDPTADTALNSI